MDANIIYQAVDSHRSALKNIMSLKFSEDGTQVTIGKKRLLVVALTIFAYFVITLLLMLFAVDIHNWITAISCPIVISLWVFVVRLQTRTITFDFLKSSVIIKGRWQKTLNLPWSTYVGTETVRSIMDFPEEFFILFENEGKTNRIKFANITLALRKYNPANYDAVKSLWESIEIQMNSKQIDAENQLG